MEVSGIFFYIIFHTRLLLAKQLHELLTDTYKCTMKKGLCNYFIIQHYVITQKVLTADYYKKKLHLINIREGKRNI